MNTSEDSLGEETDVDSQPSVIARPPPKISVHRPAANRKRKNISHSQPALKRPRHGKFSIFL